MEMSLFCITHLIMFICAAIIACTLCLENIHTSVIMLLNPASGISRLKKLKTIYRTLIIESILIKSLIINMLNIGMEISNQLMK